MTYLPEIVPSLSETSPTCMLGRMRIAWHRWITWARWAASRSICLACSTRDGQNRLQIQSEHWSLFSPGNHWSCTFPCWWTMSEVCVFWLSKWFAEIHIVTHMHAHALVLIYTQIQSPPNMHAHTHTHTHRHTHTHTHTHIYIHLVKFMSLVCNWIIGVSYCQCPRSLLLCLCDIFWALNLSVWNVHSGTVHDNPV